MAAATIDEYLAGVPDFYTGRAPLQAYADELAGYRLWKGTINFQPDKPLPAKLVKKLIQVRVAEHRGR